MIWVVACSHDWCGPGTVRDGRQCVAVASDEPYLLPPSLLCGPGTIERGGVCVVGEPPVTCGPGTALRGGTCVDLGIVELYLPFVAGVTVPILQGAHGYFSHSGLEVNAIDFGVPKGTEVAAARAGRVVELREDSDTGCPEPSCGNDGNFVVVDHGDATFDQYWHLQQDGALVEVGQPVGQGEVIALSGNTGFSSEPHLHLQVRDPLGQSLPMRFADQEDGLVYAGASFTSGNPVGPAPEPFPWSTCPTDLFSFLGVALDEGAPCSRATKGPAYPVAGEVLVDGAAAAVGQYVPADDAWRYTCAEADATGFAAEVRWEPADFAARSYLVVSAADPVTCATYQGWDLSVYLALGP